jgi:spermidine synthase
MGHRLAVGLAFVSGFVALGYEILWARRLSDLIGATSLASSLVVGVFFLLLAAGAVALGPAAVRQARPWRMYALLEAGILVAILPAFFGEALAGVLAAGLGDALLRPGPSLVWKSVLALVFVGPASFLMGGTLPAMGQAVVRAGRLGHEGNVLYGANTLGGALGILATTFGLLPALGMHRSFLMLMSGSLLLAIVAWRLAAVAGPQPVARPDDDEAPVAAGLRAASRAGTATATTPRPHAAPPAVRPSTWNAIAFVSGFTVLGFEILALHLFSQVLHNSSYTFAAVLVVVIAALAAGALVTQRWQLDAPAALYRLTIVLLLAALVIAAVPRLFFVATHGMQPLGGGVGSLAGYVLRILGAAGLVLGPAFVVAGWVFPLVLAGVGVQAARRGVGTSWGRLLAINAAGALLGMVLANFVAMRVLGLWMSLALWSLPSLVAGTLLVGRVAVRSRLLLLGLAVLAFVVLVAAFPSRLPVARLAAGDRVLAWSSGADGVAAVIAQADDLDRRIKFNNTYTLGGTANSAQQARLGHLALLLHPAPQRVGFIGIATGITASAALRDPAPRSITAVELSDQITGLACRHFADHNAELCSDARVRVVVEDGRLFFRASRERFDVVVGDLFVPWQAGTANLYTVEQFAAVHDHLAPGGLFAQWLPLFQLDEVGFWGIANTFTSVFPNAWLAIADFQPYNPAVALIGWRDAGGGPSYEVLAARCREVLPGGRLREPTLVDPDGVGMYLVGPVAAEIRPEIPLLTLDRAWLNDHAPRVQRAQPPVFFVGRPLVETLQRIAAHAPQDALRPAIDRGQRLYEFCEILPREGPRRAAAWFDANVGPLPSHIFGVDNPGQLSWPFPMEAGMFLIGRARRAPD